MTEVVNQVLDVKVHEVTVYPDQARVSLAGKLELKPGRQKIVFEDLPLVLVPESVRMGGKGEAKVRLLNVDIRRAHYERTPQAKARQLEDEILEVEDDLKALVDEQEVMKAQGRYLEGLRQASEQFARGLALGRTKVEDQLTLTGFLKEQDLELRQASRRLNKQKREVQNRLDKLQRELRELMTARPKERYQVIVETEALSGGTFKPEITYVVNQAGWQPLYDVRLTEEGEVEKLTITHLAEIYQRTGQDWNGVVLHVSTARPALSQRAPDLKPWYVDEYRPPEIMPRRAMAQSSRPMSLAATSAEADVMADMAPEPAALLEEEASYALAEVQERNAIITYKVSGANDIPGDGSTRKVTVSESYLEPKRDYLTIPKHTDAVYRRVKATNSGTGPMLPGPASLFVEHDFVGSIRLGYIAAGEEIELLIGVEERVTIERELVRREVDKKRLRDRRQLQYGYKIEIHNLLPTEIDVEVRDHIPVARHEEIKVKLLSVAPEPAERSDLNLFEWQLSFSPGQERAISYDFLVEYPRAMKISGLVD